MMLVEHVMTGTRPQRIMCQGWELPAAGAEVVARAVQNTYALTASKVSKPISHMQKSSQCNMAYESPTERA